MENKKPRIIGLNVARGLAVCGMIIVNFSLVFGSEGPEWIQAISNFFKGKAAASFVCLAGVGLGLLVSSAEGNPLREAAVKKRVFKRALILLILGLTYYSIWPADILHYYGVYMLIALAFLFQPAAYSLRFGGLLIVLFPILLFNFDYTEGWNWETLDYLDFWSLEGFFRNLFFNGFHPFIPWMAFLLIGMWLGRQDLYDETFILALFQRGLALFITIQVLSPFAVSKAIEVMGFSPESAEYVFGTGSMPPNPMYMLNGIGFAFTLISGSIWWAWKRKESRVIKALDRTGRFALSLYIIHVILGMTLPLFFTEKEYGEFSIYFSLAYSLLFSVFGVFLAMLWLSKAKHGPFEWLLRKLSA